MYPKRLTETDDIIFTSKNVNNFSQVIN